MAPSCQFYAILRLPYCPSIDCVCVCVCACAGLSTQWQRLRKPWQDLSHVNSPTANFPSIECLRWEMYLIHSRSLYSTAILFVCYSIIDWTVCIIPVRSRFLNIFSETGARCVCNKQNVVQINAIDVEWLGCFIFCLLVFKVFFFIWADSKFIDVATWVLSAHRFKGSPHNPQPEFVQLGHNYR